MTPYRERREKGYYNPQGEKPANTTTTELGGLGTPQKPGKKPARKKR